VDDPVVDRTRLTVTVHARTIVAVIDALGLDDCGIVGHSMGGGVGVHVATARPTPEPTR
jgi:pimeloyl-ACP methyl ester carboxylesterase